MLHPPAEQPEVTDFDLERKHFPYFIADKELTLSSVKVFLQPNKKDGQINTTGLTLKVNNVAVLAGMWTPFGENMKVSELTIAGTPFMKWTIDAGIEGLDSEELGDVLLLLKYTAS